MTFFPPLCILLCSSPFIIHSGEYIDIYYLQCPFPYTTLHLRFFYILVFSLPLFINLWYITIPNLFLISLSPRVHWLTLVHYDFPFILFIYICYLIHYLYQKIRFSFNNFDEVFLISQINIYFQIYRKTYYLHIVCMSINYIPIFKISTRNLLWFDLCIFSFTSFFTQHPSFHLISSQQF